MGRNYVRKKPITAWDALRYEQHAEVQCFVHRHPDGAHFAEIGAAMNVTRQRAQQIYERAIAKLRDHFGVNPAELDEGRLPGLDELHDLERREEHEQDEEGDDERQTWAA